MKILHTAPTLDVTYGGPTTCIYHLLRGINKHYKADLLALANKEGQKCLWNDEFIKLVPNDAKTPFLISSNFKKYLLNHISEYDIVHANTIWTYFSHISTQIALKNNKPLVLSPHGMLYPQALAVSSWKKKLVLPLFQRKDLENATCLHATCVQEYEHLRNFGLSNPICIVPNCLNLNIDSLVDRVLPNKVRKFGFVGRIHPIKNIHLLLESWSSLGPLTKDSELIIVGDGDKDYLHTLKTYVDSKQLKNVQFKGFLTGDSLLQEVRNFDFQVLPSKSENFGMVVPEALINRVPVIASEGTPWQELNDFNCGWWIKLESLTDALKQALSLSEDERKLMGERGRNLVLEKYTINKVSEQMCSVYNYLLGNEPKPTFYID